MVGGGGELVVRYGTSMVRRVMVIAALVASCAQKSRSSIYIISIISLEKNINFIQTSILSKDKIGVDTVVDEIKQNFQDVSISKLEKLLKNKFLSFEIFFFLLKVSFLVNKGIGDLKSIFPLSNCGKNLYFICENLLRPFFCR